MSDTRIFWEWFATAKPRLENFSHQRDDALLDEVQAALQRYSPGLWFEMGGHPDGPMELIISAEGDSDYFDDVRRLVAAAPDTRGWRFIAFKPPQGFEFRTEYEGVVVDPADCWFLPMQSKSNPTALGLRVAVPGFTDELESTNRAAVYIVLDTGLGELVATEAVHHLEVVPLPASPETDGYIKLNELGQYVTWREQREA
jgi:hypothetical protein